MEQERHVLLLVETAMYLDYFFVFVPVLRRYIASGTARVMRVADFAFRSDTAIRIGAKKVSDAMDPLWFCAMRVQKMPHLRLPRDVAMDPLLQFTIRFCLT